MLQTEDNGLFWLWLSLRCTVDGKTYELLSQHFSSPYEIYLAEEEQLREALGKETADLRRLTNKSLEDAQGVMDFCAAHCIGILTLDSPAYPPLLKAIKHPPLVLYFYGKLPRFSETLYTAVVGTRNPSEYGKRMAFEIAHDLALSGAVVVSGMAKGIDGIAHAGALSAGGVTVAVLGGGFDNVYPKEHRKLLANIARNGVVFTEYPPGSVPYRSNFPKRNRIISGMCEAVLVVEGDGNSGALITAKKAFQQNRKVYSLPGNVDSITSEGPNILIQQGAKVALSADAIVDDFKFTYSGRLNEFCLLDKKPVDMEKWLNGLRVDWGTDYIAAPAWKFRKESTAASAGGASAQTAARAGQRGGAKAVSKDADSIPVKKQPPAEKREIHFSDENCRRVYERIPEEGDCLPDSLATSDLPIGKVLFTLTMLEIDGLIETSDGGRVKRKI